MTETKTERIVTLHREHPGLTMPEIAAQVGCSHVLVCNVKRKFGLAIPSGGDVSPEAHAKSADVRRGRKLTAEHRAAISRGVLRAHPKRERRQRIMAALEEEQRADFENLTSRYHYSFAKALATLGRDDLNG